MNLMPLKKRYWQLCNRLHQWRNPPQTVLTPEDPLVAMQRLLAPCGERIVMVDGGAHDGVVACDFASRLTGLEVHAFEPILDQEEPNRFVVSGDLLKGAFPFGDRAFRHRRSQGDEPERESCPFLPIHDGPFLLFRSPNAISH